MSIFDYIGLTICGLFFIAFGIAATLDSLHSLMNGQLGNKLIRIPIWTLIIWGCYEGLVWIYYY